MRGLLLSLNDCHSESAEGMYICVAAAVAAAAVVPSDGGGHIPRGSLLCVCGDPLHGVPAASLPVAVSQRPPLHLPEQVLQGLLATPLIMYDIEVFCLYAHHNSVWGISMSYGYTSRQCVSFLYCPPTSGGSQEEAA